MPLPLRFVHLTDLHIVHPDLPEPGVKTDTVATLKAIRAMVDRIAPRPSFIAVSGDLTNRGDPGSFAHLRELMAGIDVPVLYALGNHDHRASFYQGLLGRSHGLDAPYDHDIVIDGLHIITLDTSTPGKVGGTLTSEQLQWLAAALERETALPKLLMMHHAPALDNDPDEEWWHSLNHADTLRFADVVKGKNVVGILSGHIHQDRVAHWHGIPVVISMGQHCALDPLYAGDGTRSVRGTSFVLGTLRDSGLTVNFVPLPSDREELSRMTLQQLRDYEAKLTAAPAH